MLVFIVIVLKNVGVFSFYIRVLENNYSVLYVRNFKGFFGLFFLFIKKGRKRIFFLRFFVGLEIYIIVIFFRFLGKRRNVKIEL